MSDRAAEAILKTVEAHLADLFGAGNVRRVESDEVDAWLKKAAATTDPALKAAYLEMAEQ